MSVVYAYPAPASPAVPAGHAYAISRLGKTVYERLVDGWHPLADQPPLVGEGALLLATSTSQLVIYDEDSGPPADEQVIDLSPYNFNFDDHRD
jgi:hypothetical protein